MGTTPEGRVKQRVKDILCKYERMYYHMPVQTGYGKTSLDFIGCYNGLFFSIETKVEGKTPTPRQRQTIEEMQGARGAVFVITGVSDALGFLALVSWLETNRATTHDHTHQPSA